VIVVAGPPGAGKTTWVNRRMRSGAGVLERDRLWMAISNEMSHTKPAGLFPLVDAAFMAVLKEMDKAAVAEQLRTVWIITGTPKKKQRQEYRDRFDAEILVFEVQPNTCLKQIMADDDRVGGLDAWSPLVHKWWREYEPDPLDTVVRERD